MKNTPEIQQIDADNSNKIVKNNSISIIIKYVASNPNIQNILKITNKIISLKASDSN